MSRLDRNVFSQILGMQRLDVEAGKGFFIEFKSVEAESRRGRFFLEF